MGTRTDGVHTLDDLRQRCNVDEDDGCWRWRMERVDGSARVHMLVDGKRTKMSGRRAALILAGKRIPAGHEAYARPACPHTDCVNPEHCRSGTRGDVRRFLASRGRWSLPHCYAHLLPHAAAMRKLDDAQRLEVAQSSESAKVLAARYGCSTDLINKVRSGERRAAPASSVFAWRPA